MKIQTPHNYLPKTLPVLRSFQQLLSFQRPPDATSQNLASRNLLDSFRLGSMQKLDTQNRGKNSKPWIATVRLGRGGASSNSLTTEKRATQQETNNRSPGSVTDSATEDNSDIPNRCSSMTDLTTQEKTNNQTRASVTKRRTPVGHSGSTNQTHECRGSTSQTPSG